MIFVRRELYHDSYLLWPHREAGARGTVLNWIRRRRLAKAVFATRAVMYKRRRAFCAIYVDFVSRSLSVSCAVDPKLSVAFSMSKKHDIQHDRVTPAGPRVPASSRSSTLPTISPGEGGATHPSFHLHPNIYPYVGMSAHRSAVQGTPSTSHKQPAGREATHTTDFNRSLSVISSGPVPSSPASTTHTIQPNPRTVSDAGYHQHDPSSHRRIPRDNLGSTAGYSSGPSSALGSHHRPQKLSLPGSGSRKSSAASIDRDAGAHLDLKRLMSKPALHTPSTSSILSLPSDSERSPTSHRAPQILSGNAAARYRSHKPSMERLPVGAGPSGSRSSSSQRPESRNATAPPADLPREPSQKPVRNVLRRKASGRPASAAAGTDTQGASSSSLLHHAPSRHRIRPSETSSSVATHRPATSPSHTTSARLKTATVPTGLTPAGAVAHAYKQQEQRREELTDFSGSRVQAARANGALDLETGRLHSPSLQYSPEEEGNGPYYTVYGSSSEQVAARNVLDGAWQVDSFISVEDRTRKPSNANTLPRRSLSRKMSGRLKSFVKRERDVSPFETVGEADGRGRDEWRPYDGQHPPKMRSESVSQSPRTGDFVDVAEKSAHSRRSLPASGHGQPRKQEVERGLRTAKSAKGKDKDADDDSPTSGKFWKLVKRISTGGLRDKYKPPRDSSPPPVPALPANFQKLASTRMTLEIPKASSHGDPNETGVLLSRFMQSRSSLSGVRPSTSSSHKKHTTSSRPSTSKGSNASVPRPSTTTRSSSPVSSDIASSGFFHRTHSTRSSTSSYGEELPPMPTAPKSTIGQQIMSLSELERLNAEEAADVVPQITQKKLRKPSRTHSAPSDDRPYPSSADETLPSLPAPPRRQTRSVSHQELRDSPSPTIPSFSTEHTVNNFSTPSLPLSEFGTTAFPDAPPRPKRSERRQLNIDVPAASASGSARGTPATPRTPRAATSNRAPSVALSFASTAKQTPLSSASPSVSVSLLSPQNRPPLTFREMESPRHAWSEQEKADAWDALLERSNRAGGTIHIGEPGLLSEGSRLSYSEV
ncbi:hypothetical protein B0H21DRAFT_808033 [Amylocystis lapponica]|nr:hypothetical protein B0H21DRAFT_808033 [Amylocystis lapponica]